MRNILHNCDNYEKILPENIPDDLTNIILRNLL